MKKLMLVLPILFMCGCATQMSIKTPRVILLPEERIFTVPAGQEIAVNLDKKPLKMTFPEDMKLVSTTTLIRQEEKLNNAILDKVKADKNRNKWISLIGSLFMAGASALGIWFKYAKQVKK